MDDDDTSAIDNASLIRGYDLPPTAECGRCGEMMILVEELYYVHADTNITYCPKKASDGTG